MNFICTTLNNLTPIIYEQRSDKSASLICFLKCHKYNMDQEIPGSQITIWCLLKRDF